MTCLLNTFGLISNLANIIKFLTDKEEGKVNASLTIDLEENSKENRKTSFITLKFSSLYTKLFKRKQI